MKNPNQIIKALMSSQTESTITKSTKPNSPKPLKQLHTAANQAVNNSANTASQSKNVVPSISTILDDNYVFKTNKEGMLNNIPETPPVPDTPALKTMHNLSKTSKKVFDMNSGNPLNPSIFTLLHNNSLKKTSKIRQALYINNKANNKDKNMGR